MLRAPSASVPFAPPSRPAEAGAPESQRSPGGPGGAAASWGAFAAAAGVAALVGALFPYVILKVGFGPNASIVSTLAAGALLSARRGARPGDRVALHLAQAAGVAAAQSAFGCVALAALELWRGRAGLEAVPRPSGGGALVVWLAAAGCLGVLVAGGLRRAYLADAALPFAGGVVGAEAILVFESGRRALGGRLRALAKAAAASAAWALASAGRPGAWGGVALGSGILLGPRVALSLGAGSLAARGPLAPTALWAAVGLVLGSSLARALLARAAPPPGAAPASARGPRGPGGDGDLPPRARWLAALAALVALCASGRDAWGVPVWLTLAGVALSLPLLLVGARVLGETSWAPATTLTAAAQALLGLLVPGCASAMVVGSAAGGAIPACGAHLLQSLRTAQLVGARPRETALAQLLGTAVGAAALGVTFPLLARHYGFGSNGLAPPLGLRLAELGESLARGPGALPPGARWALAAAALAGAALALAERRFGRRAPSAAALGVGLLLPLSASLPALAGALGAAAWARARPAASREFGAPVAAGLVAGEAVVAVVAALFA
ncbi:MAG TPA: OPT/YSL family transporter [Polyangiaceae bacterium]|nr:OPT/YSL family transporter [Polyangiaceae bacterium]